MTAPRSEGSRGSRRLGVDRQAFAVPVAPLAGPVEGVLRVPGSKSLTARALVAAALAGGTSTITGALISEDTDRMIDSLRRLGASLTVQARRETQASVAPLRAGGFGIASRTAGALGTRAPRSASRGAPHLEAEGLAVTSSPAGGRAPGPPVTDGVKTTAPASGASGATVVVRGAPGGLARRAAALQVGLAGTVARFLTPLSATGDEPVVLDGTPRMRERPMADLVRSLRQLGARVEALGAADCLPLRVTGPLRGGEVAVAGDTSSQFLSGLLLAAPAMPQGLEVTLTTTLVSRPYVDMTIATMAAFGVLVEEDLPKFTVRPGQRYQPAMLDIEPDASAASYVFAAAAITGSRLCVAGLHRHAVQGDVGFVDLLDAMGASVSDEPDGICVAGPRPQQPGPSRGERALRGITVDMSDRSDVAQSLAVVAPFATSATTITGIGFIRGKETDRIGATVEELQRCGIDAEELPDGMTIRPGHGVGAVIDTHGDHRMAMSFAMLGLQVPGIVITEPQVVAKTFPDFFELVDQIHQLPPRSTR